jgi:hypothetical protein
LKRASTKVLCIQTICVQYVLHRHLICDVVGCGAGQLFKKLIDSIKDLVTEGNFDCSESGMSLQAMVPSV